MTMENPAEDKTVKLKKNNTNGSSMDKQPSTGTNLWDLLPPPSTMPMKMPSSVGSSRSSRRSSEEEGKRKVKKKKKSKDEDNEDESSSSSKPKKSSRKRTKSRSKSTSGDGDGDGDDGDSDKKNGRVFRSSKVIRSKLDGDELGHSHVNLNSTEDVEDPNKKRHTSAPTNYIDLMGNTMGTRTAVKKRLGPCLKRQDSESSQITHSSIRKAVKFAVNPQGRVWCLTRTYRKEPKSKRNQLWWSEEEFEARADKDADLINDEDEENFYYNEYGGALHEAYESVSDATAETSIGDVALSFGTYASCNAARGLEADVYEGISQNTTKHRKGVMAAQKLMRKKKKESDKNNGSDNEDYWNEESADDADAKLIRLQSLKFSRRSALVAAKLGHFDQLVTTNLADDDSLYSEEDSDLDDLMDDIEEEEPEPEPEEKPRRRRSFSRSKKDEGGSSEAG